MKISQRKEKNGPLTGLRVCNVLNMVVVGSQAVVGVKVRWKIKRFVAVSNGA